MGREDTLLSALRLYEEGSLDQSERLYLQVIKEDDQLAEAHYGLGLIQHSRKDYAGARKWFERCLHVDASHENALYYLASIAELDGDPGTATGLYAKVISLNPGHRSARSRLTSLLGQSSPGRGVSEAQAAGRSPPHPPLTREWSGSVVGRITRVNRRQESFANSPGGVQVLDFTVQGYDNSGRETQQYSASLRGRKIVGAMPDVGDWVELESRYKHGSLQPTKIRNLATGGLTRVPIGWRG